MVVTVCSLALLALGTTGDPPVIGVVKVDRLVAQVGVPFEIPLAMPDGAGWKEVNVARIMVREGEGQRDLTLPADADALKITFEKPGYALVALDVGPAAARNQPDSWRQVTHCVKLVIRVEGNAPTTQTPEPLQTTAIAAKLGSRIEILPLIDPTRLRVGNDLPVRVYLDGDKVAEAPIAAVGPDGKVREAVTDRVGSTHVRIDLSGRWRFIFEIESEGLTRRAELIFEVPTEKSEGSVENPGGSAQQPSGGEPSAQPEGQRS